VENGDSDTQGPHAVKNDQWVGYDDTRMMAIKVIFKTVFENFNCILKLKRLIIDEVYRSTSTSI